LLTLEETTQDTLLGGRVRLRQPRRGLRAAIDAVLLAAGVPARPGDRVLEAGCGTGAAFLCLGARVPGVGVVAIERDVGLAALARENAAANGGEAEVLVGDIADPVLAARIGPVAHAFANPPWWPDGTPPPDPLRRAATHVAGADLATWAACLAAPVVAGGTVSLLLPAGRLADGLAALALAGCGGPRITPFWPRVGEPAKRALLQARRHRAGPCVLAAGLVLHDAAAGYSAAAEAVLRDGAALPGG
jgi:tRNA1Val (adenine37-N6)-methyltransferase